MSTSAHQFKTIQNEEELNLIQLAQKDPQHFGFIYQKYHEPIFRYIYNRLNDEEQAFDITSQVFMKALHRINTFEYRGIPFSSWLYRIAKSELYQSFRDKKNICTVNLDSFELTEIIDEMEEDYSEENKKKLVLALTRLKQIDVQLIELRFFEKRTFKEIGEILEITENNAKVKAFRALEKLKQLFNVTEQK
jgi:RNA polymerase sigma-70 factor (ECF subfamily)